MKDRKGFTLVELLAVIVILAIIMIIAIPSVLGTLETARRKTFVEYITRVFEAGQNQYLTQVSTGNLPDERCQNTTKHTKPCYVDTFDMREYFYDITTDLGLSSTGSYKGYVCVVPANQVVEETQILVGLYDNNYMTQTIVSDEGEDTKDRYYINYTLYGEPKTDEIVNVNNYGIRDMEARYINTNSDVLPWGIGNLCYNKVTSS